MFMLYPEYELGSKCLTSVLPFRPDMVAKHQYIHQTHTWFHIMQCQTLPNLFSIDPLTNEFVRRLAACHSAAATAEQTCLGVSLGVMQSSGRTIKLVE